MNLTGKVTLVTGASRGIGRQIALTLAGYGATVIVNYNGSAAKAEEVVNEITANGGMAESMQCSVSDFEKSKEMIDGIVKKYGRLDILVNNAGITKDNLIMKMSEDDFDAVIATNLKGAFNCIKHVSRQMLKQRGGRIINISSVSGVMGNAGQANYCASKAGIIGLTKSVARELGSRGITANAVAPGFIRTEMTDVLPEDVKKAMGEQIPLKRFGETSHRMRPLISPDRSFRWTAAWRCKACKRQLEKAPVPATQPDSGCFGYHLRGAWLITYLEQENEKHEKSCSNRNGRDHPDRKRC